MLALARAGIDVPAWNTGTEDLGTRASVTIIKHAKRALLDGIVEPVGDPAPGLIVVCRDANDNSPHVAVCVDSEWLLHGTQPAAMCERVDAFRQRYTALSFVRWKGRADG